LQGLLLAEEFAHFLPAGKDKAVKYWDADKFEQLLELNAHQGPVWGLAVSHLGDLVVSCGGDRAIRRWGHKHPSLHFLQSHTC